MDLSFGSLRMGPNVAFASLKPQHCEGPSMSPLSAWVMESVHQFSLPVRDATSQQTARCF
eukprot:4440702-Amphidinium_carterae.1